MREWLTPPTALTWQGAHSGFRRSPEAAFSQITRVTSLLTVGFHRPCPLGHGGEQRPLIEQTTMRAPHESGTGSGQARGSGPTRSRSRANVTPWGAAAASAHGWPPALGGEPFLSRRMGEEEIAAIERGLN